jgi:hypothetical protein
MPLVSAAARKTVNAPDPRGPRGAEPKSSAETQGVRAQEPARLRLNSQESR